jgi:adenine-specific DNA methylase
MMLELHTERKDILQTEFSFSSQAQTQNPRFPDTKYMGSKQALLPFVMSHVSALNFTRVLDAFSGSACVAYALKQLGAEVHTNDFLKFAFHTARATVENNSTLLRDCDVSTLLRKNRNAQDFIERTFAGLYFAREDDRFLDNLWANIQELRSPMKRSLALAAACRAAMKKRPRGIFTFTGKKGWDSRQDLRLSMKEQFLMAVEQLNGAVFSNKLANRAYCQDVLEIDPSGYDLVYIDPPYVSPFSDCDYTRRYHFVEGFCTYWSGVELLTDTLTKKIRSYPTIFSSKSTAINAFDRVFNHFRRSTLVVSYSSNSIPHEAEMRRLMLNYKSTVKLYKLSHKYSHGNHRHKVGKNNNSVYEYLFVAS